MPTLIWVWVRLACGLQCCEGVSHSCWILLAPVSLIYANLKSKFFNISLALFAHLWNQSALFLGAFTTRCWRCKLLVECIQYRRLLCFSPSWFLCDLLPRPFRVCCHRTGPPCMKEAGGRFQKETALYPGSGWLQNLCAIYIAWKLHGRLDCMKLACICQNNRKNNLIAKHSFSSTGLFYQDANDVSIVVWLAAFRTEKPLWRRVLLTS